MFDIIFSLIIFVLFIVLKTIGYFIGKKHNVKDGFEVLYLSRKFNLDKKKLNTFKMNLIISICDAFIVSLTLILVTNITKSYILEMLLSVILIVVLIIIIYGLLGKILIKKGFKKDEQSK